MEEKSWPHVGDRLVHRSRRKPSDVTAEVVEIDRKAGRIALQIGKKRYESLSAAAKAVAGHEANGWIYWGLKKQPQLRSKQK